MSEWWTYRLTSFLLFSPRTYRRLFELYNLAIWPAQIVALAVGLTVVALLVRAQPRRSRVAFALLAACWTWVAWAFLDRRYAQINWVATDFAVAFAAEAALLIVFAVVGNRLVPDRAVGLRFPIAMALVAMTVVAYPVLAKLDGRTLATAETFGVTPDPTVLATALALSVARTQVRWLLLVVPLSWCAVTGALLWAMHAVEAYVVTAVALAALALAFRKHVARVR